MPRVTAANAEHFIQRHMAANIFAPTHKMMLEHYQQTKCLLVSYSDKPLGLF